MSGTAQGLFTVGAAIFVAAGGGHALLSLVDTVRPTWFAPRDDGVRRAMEGTGMRFRRLFPGDAGRPSLWRCWLGFNVSHGLGAFAFGVLCLLLASADFALVERTAALRWFPAAVSAAYFLTAMRYWFNGVQLMTAVATACFVAAALLAG